MVFGEYASALKMRDAVRKITTGVVNDMRPDDKIGRAYDVDRVTGIAHVVFSGSEDSPVRVQLLPGIQPQRYDKRDGTGNGSIVRVSGGVGARYISAIVSDAPSMISPRHQSPSVLGGDGDSTAYTTFSFDMDGTPVSDGTTHWWTIITNFPKCTGFVEIYTEITLDTGATWCMVENHTLQSDTFSDTATNLVTQSSTGMDMRTRFTAYNGSIDGQPAGTLGVTYYLLRQATSTKIPVSMRITYRVFGTDFRLVKITDGFNSSV